MPPSSSSSSSSSSRKKGKKHASPDSVMPLSQRIHTESIQGGGHRDFYTRVMMDVPKRHYDSDFEPKTSKFTIKVGDLVAVQCKESVEPIKKPFSRKSPWYPFTTHWSPGQIVAIYRNRSKGSAFEMQIRWLYRKQDFIETEEKAYPNNKEDRIVTKQFLENDKEHHWQMLYESQVFDCFNVQVVLGKVVLTTYEHNALQGQYMDPVTGMPQTTGVCRYRVGPNEELIHIHDWDAYNDWKPGYVLPSPLLRGLETPGSFACNNKKLKNVYVDALWDVWKDDHEKKESVGSLDPTDSAKKIAKARNDSKKSCSSSSSSSKLSTGKDRADTKRPKAPVGRSTRSNANANDKDVGSKLPAPNKTKTAAAKKRGGKTTNISNSKPKAGRGNDEKVEAKSEISIRRSTRVRDTERVDGMELVPPASRPATMERTGRSKPVAIVVDDSDTESPQVAAARKRKRNNSTRQGAKTNLVRGQLDTRKAQAKKRRNNGTDKEEEKPKVTWYPPSPGDSVQPVNHMKSREATINGRILHVPKNKRREYFESIDIRVRTDACAPLAFKLKSSDTHLWKLQVGDVVCVECDGSNEQAEHILQRRQNLSSPLARKWFPFLVEWSYCQVLSIYRDIEKRNGTTTAAEVSLELRWLYRRSDLPEATQNILPFELDENLEEIFETDCVEPMFPASSVLGRVDLFLGDADEICNARKKEKNSMIVPHVQCRCRHFFPFHMNSVPPVPQPLLYAETEPDVRYGAVLERGLKISELMTKDPKLKHDTSVLLASQTSSGFDPDVDDIQSSVQTVPPYRSVQAHSHRREYLTSVSISPPWSNYHLADLLWPPTRERKDLRWRVRVGDVVALHCEAASCPTHYSDKKNMWYPFRVPWSPCQILAIFRDDPGTLPDDHGTSSAPTVLIEIRWLYRENDFPEKPTVLQKLHSGSKGLEMLFETDHVEKDPYHIASLLGPVRLATHDRDCIDETSSLAHEYLPMVLQMYCGEYGTQDKKGPKIHKTRSSQELLERGLQISTHHKTKKDKLHLIGLLHNQNSVEDEVELEMPTSDTFIDAAEEEGTAPTRTARARQTRQSQGPRETSSAITKRHSSNTKATEQYRSAVEGFIVEATDVKQSGDETPEDNYFQDVEMSDEGDSSEAGLSAAETNIFEGRIGVPTFSPYHVDVSSLKSFHKMMYVLPPYDTYLSGLTTGKEKQASDAKGNLDNYWTVKLGDIVSVRWSPSKTGKNTFPFNVAWAVGEVVTIWWQHTTKEEICKLQKKMASSTVSTPAHFPEQGRVMVELRWFYRKDELPGSTQSMVTTMNLDADEYEEVIETDVFNEIDALTILAPANLHPEATVETSSLPILGMPVVDFHCRRFYSVHRKSLVPCGSMSGMTERGRMHSSYLGKDQVLRAALDRCTKSEQSTTIPTNGGVDVSLSSAGYRDVFQPVIQKLSLIDASEATDVRGLRLIGREREQDRIVSFLRSAIRGEAFAASDEYRDSVRRASLFVAGPPGTGKTASVRSAVERLRHEQANGDIPEFQFVYLNGMEMRHPFEAYVKLWEVLSGTNKEKRPPGVAAALLERHFTGESGKGNHERDGKRCAVTVLLLDEIDYLVTKKQTVLYNLFDWPRATASRESGPRLVVVGISNTLNLPERLKPSVQSRLGGERCNFASYKVDEMVQILKVKVELDSSSAASVFEDDAIMFASRKTATLSGDVRKALQMCKAAAEAVLSELEAGTREGGPVVRIRDVQRVSREWFSSVMSKAVSLLAPFEALLLVTLASLTRTSGRTGGFDIKEVMTKMESIATGSGDLQYMPPPTFAQTLDMLNRLGEGRLVTLHTPKSSCTTFRAAQGGSGGAWPLISLPMEDSNVLTALRNSPHSSLAEKYLRAQGW